LHLQPLKDIHLHSNLTNELGANSDIRSIYSFSIVAVLILSIAAINFVNLSTARSGQRAKEIGMRKVLGASRPQLIKQFLGESLFFAFLALPVAWMLVELILPQFNVLVSKSLTFGGTKQFLAIFSLTLLVGIAAGSYTAFFLSAFQPARALKGQLRTGVLRAVLRKNLVILQFVIAIALILCTLIIYSQMHYVRTKNLGYNKDQVIVLPVFSVMKNVEAFKNELRQSSHVIEVAGTSWVPGNKPGASGKMVSDEGGEVLSFLFVDSEPAFIEILEMKIIRGSNFTRVHKTERPKSNAPEEFMRYFQRLADQPIILNQTAVKKLGLESPVGQRMSQGVVIGTIVGVIEDFHILSLHHPILPLVLRATPSTRYIVLRVDMEDITGTITHLKKTWEEFIPGLPFDFFFLDEHLDRLYSAEQKLSRLFGYFAFLAIFIACLGLFGLAAYAAERRTKEIGIRKVLGATVANVTGLLSKDFVKLVLLANLIAWPVAWYAMNKWLENFAYRIEISWWVFALAGGLALVIALLTVSAQAIRAALANPVESLRYE
jgi:putative ABC transport system permease protein